MSEKVQEKLTEYRSALSEEQTKLRSLEKARSAVIKNIERLHGAIGALNDLIEQPEESVIITPPANGKSQPS